MNGLDHDRVMEILAEAMDLPEPRRAGFLDSTCPGEPILRERVEELLRYAPSATRIFDAATEQVVGADPEQIGPYSVLEPVGEGGMAIVYKAQQHHPVKRIVAIKLIKLGMDTRQFVARFEAERQALAMMDHPNVARVFDAGATETGRPYFVMEHVSGLPILEYCDQKQLDTRQRLELFTSVCEAVEHAHQKGILHRDIKNTNVLVTELEGKPIPKVIDFGVAKALHQQLTERTLQTEQGQLIGTPEYMSPEQAERGSGAIDTRSDVYSLGVLLYELIAGVRPIPSDVLRSAGYEQVQRIIRESEPARPSTRLSTLGGADATRIAERRRTALPTLIRNLRRELEWIPLKAMRKDREQRYRSAAELSDDIRNYLDGRPLLAGPESTPYKLKKFLRRHRTGVAASAAMILLLMTGIVATTWQAVRASRAESTALTERDNARATLDFLTQRVLAGATPVKIPDARVRDQIVQAMIAPAAEHVGKFQDRPLIEASVREAIQTVLREIGRPDLAEPHARTVVDIRRRLLGNDSVETLAAINDLAFALKRLARFAEAEPLYIEAVAGLRRVLGDDHPVTLTSSSNLAALYVDIGRLADAEVIHRSVLDKRRATLGDAHTDTYQSLNNLGSVLQVQNKLAEAEALYREALGRPRSAAGEDHPDTLKIYHNLATVLELGGKYAEAEPWFRESLVRSRRVLGDEHMDTLVSEVSLASLLHDTGKLEEAQPLYRHALDTARRTVGADHRYTMTFAHNFATLLADQGKLDEADAAFREVLERRRRVLSADHPSTLATMHHLASLLARRGQLVEAEAAWREVIAARTHVLGAEHPNTLSSIFGLVLVLRDLRKLSEAESTCRDLSLAANRVLGETHPNAMRIRAALDALQPSTEPATRPN